MERLLELILEKLHEPYGPDKLDVTEFYRELGRFEEALNALKQCPSDDIGVPERLMERSNIESVALQQLGMTSGLQSGENLKKI